MSFASLVLFDFWYAIGLFHDCGCCGSISMAMAYFYKLNDPFPIQNKC